jgi:hypothetical protein
MRARGGASVAREIEDSLAEFDFNRSPARAAHPERFKQWVHTTVVHPEIALVANFASTYARDRAGDHYATLLVYAGTVGGHVRRFSAEECRTPLGRTATRFGCNQIARAGGEYHLELSEPALRLRADIRLRPLVPASALQNVGVGSERTFNWAVVPRLVASGLLTYCDRSYVLDDAPAYHDRNWGCFAFGDFTWDWGYATATNGDADCAVVFTRVMSRARARVIEQDVLVWSEGELLTSFRDREVTLRAFGRRTGPFTTVPASLALCRPGSASDVPQSLIVNAESARGRLELRFEAAQTARIVVPNDGRLGTSVIHETAGRADVAGRIEGRAIAFGGHGFLESFDG